MHEFPEEKWNAVGGSGGVGGGLRQSVRCGGQLRPCCILCIQAAFLRPPTVFLLLNSSSLRASAAPALASRCPAPQIIDVILNAPFHATKAALPAMIDAGWGRVVNTGTPPPPHLCRRYPGRVPDPVRPAAACVDSLQLRGEAALHFFPPPPCRLHACAGGIALQECLQRCQAWHRGFHKDCGAGGGWVARCPQGTGKHGHSLPLSSEAGKHAPHAAPCPAVWQPAASNAALVLHPSSPPASPLPPFLDACQVATKGVTCNAVCPGYVMTELIEKQLANQAKTRGIPKACARALLSSAAMRAGACLCAGCVCLCAVM